MIRDHAAVDDPNHALAVGIIEQVDRMAELIRRRVERSRQNKHTVARQPVGEVVRRAGHLLEPILDDRQLDLSFEEEPNVVAFFDAEALLQVLTNLILISGRTSEPGTRIDVRLSRIVADSSVPPQVEPGRFALLRVINPGPDPDPTLAIELASRDEGLGLSYRLCEDIVEGLGGFIDFESAPGHGTTFSVFLPKTAANKV
jgi:signal transduction histidine kinase